MKVSSQNNRKANSIFKAVLFCIVFTFIFVLFSLLKNFLPYNYERLAHGIVGTLAALTTTALFLKFDKKRFSDIGLVFTPGTIAKFFAGVLAGVLIMGLLAISVIYFSGVGVEVNDGSNALHFFWITLPLLPLAFMEELGFRAYPLTVLKEKTGIRLSIIITSLLFALYHVVNGWTIMSSFMGPAVWGLVFGLAAVYANGIAMPTGIHYAANLTTAAFGTAGNTVSIWTLQQTNAPATSQGIDWALIIPAFALLVFAVICIELYIKRKTKTQAILLKSAPAEL